MKDTSLVKDGRSCTRSGGRPEATEARKVAGAQGEPREYRMPKNNMPDVEKCVK